MKYAVHDVPLKLASPFVHAVTERANMMRGVSIHGYEWRKRNTRDTDGGSHTDTGDRVCVVFLICVPCVFVHRS